MQDRKEPLHRQRHFQTYFQSSHRKKKEQDSSGRRWQRKADGRNSSQSLPSLFQRKQQHEGWIEFLCVKQRKKTLVTTKASNRRPNTIETNQLLSRELSSVKTICKPLSPKTGHLISYVQVCKKQMNQFYFNLFRSLNLMKISLISNEGRQLTKQPTIWVAYVGLSNIFIKE